MRDAEHLEQRAHGAAPGAGQPLQGRLDIRRDLRAGLAHQRRRARLDAEASQEITLFHRPVQPRAGIFRGERKRLEIDMRGEIGLSSSPPITAGLA